VLPQAARTFQVRLRLRRLAQSENMRNHCSFNFFTGPYHRQPVPRHKNQAHPR
jgi:hypothetical protein